MAPHEVGESVRGIAVEVRGGIVGGTGGATGGRQRETESTKRRGCAKQGGVATRAPRGAETKERRCLWGGEGESIY
jgi:hypothetical protein